MCVCLGEGGGVVGGGEGAGIAKVTYVDSCYSFLSSTCMLLCVIFLVQF